MVRNPDAVSVALVLTAAIAFSYGLWSLASASEVPGVYCLIAGGLVLQVASERERGLGPR